MVLSVNRFTDTMTPKRSNNGDTGDSAGTEHGSTKSSPRCLDTPTPARSRAFFREQETLMSQQTLTPMTTTSHKPQENTQPLIHSEVLESIAAYFRSLENPSKVDSSKYGWTSDHILADLKDTSGCLYTLISNQFEKCIQTLQHLLRSEHSMNIQTVCDEECLITLANQVLNLVFSIKCTHGVWDFTEPQKQLLDRTSHALLVWMAEFEQRVEHNMKPKNKGVKIQHNASTISFISKNLAQVTYKVIHDLLAHRTIYSSLMYHSSLHEYSPCVLLLSQCRVFAGTQTPRGFPYDFSHQHGSSSYLNTLLVYIRTKSTLDTMMSLNNVLRASQLSSCIYHLRRLWVALSQLRVQQCVASSEFLSHNEGHVSDPPLYNTEESSCEPKNTRQTGRGEPAYANLKVLSSETLSSSIAHELHKLSKGLLSFHHLLGQFLGGGYDDVNIQHELTFAVTIASYLSLIGFLFHHDLQYIVHLVQPFLCVVRQMLKKDAETLHQRKNTIKPLMDPLPSYTFSPENTTPSAVALLNLLSNPQTFSLIRQKESDAILALFCHHHHAKHNSLSTAQKETMTAPATRINSLLGWLVWEGDLLHFYHQVVQAAQELPNEMNKKSVEQAIYQAILRGYTNVQKKLHSAFPTLFECRPQMKGGEQILGQDVLNFCQRVLECMTLCHLGEVDLGATRKKFLTSFLQEPPTTIPTLHQCIATYIGVRAVLKNPETIMTKVTEALPKFIWQYLHQSTLYSSPFHTWTTSQCCVSPYCSLDEDNGPRFSPIHQSMSLLHGPTTSNESTHKVALEIFQKDKQLFDGIEERLKTLETKVSSWGNGLTISHSDTSPCEKPLAEHFPHTQANPLSTPIRSQNSLKENGKKNDTDQNQQLHEVHRLDNVLNGSNEESYGDSAVLSSPETKSGKPCTEPEICDKPQISVSTLDNEVLQEVQMEMKQLKQYVTHLDQSMKLIKESLVKELIDRTKKEMSVYLTQTLSRTIQNHVLLALEKQQKRFVQRRHSRLLPWVSPRKSWPKLASLTTCQEIDVSNDSRYAKIQWSTSKKDTSVQGPEKESHRGNSPDKSIPTELWRGFDIDADTVSVMQEDEEYDPMVATNRAGWFDETMELLDMPDPTLPGKIIIQNEPFKRFNRASF